MCRNKYRVHPRRQNLANLFQYRFGRSSRSHKSWVHSYQRPAGSQALGPCGCNCSCVESRYLRLFRWRKRRRLLPSCIWPSWFLCTNCFWGRTPWRGTCICCLTSQHKVARYCHAWVACGFRSHSWAVRLGSSSWVAPCLASWQRLGPL